MLFAVSLDIATDDLDSGEPGPARLPGPVARSGIARAPAQLCKVEHFDWSINHIQSK